MKLRFVDTGTAPGVIKNADPIGIIGPEVGPDAFPNEGPHLYVHKRVNQYRTDIIWYVDGKLKRRKVLLHEKRIRA